MIDLTINVLGPMATQTLGDAGADVIKIEAPGDDPMRKIGPSRTPDMGSYFLNLNRNKRSVVLDLKREAAQVALRRLVERADVFVHNMRTVAAGRQGFGYPRVAAINPRIIYASATGFRRYGPYRDRGAFDDLIQGMSGLAALDGGRDGAPRYVPTVLADKFCGNTLAWAIAMALYARSATDKAQQVHVPMLESMPAFNLIEHLWGATLREPKLGLCRPYPTKDGYISVIAVTDEQWRRLFTAIGRPGLIEDKRFATLSARVHHIDSVYAVLTEAMTECTTKQWCAILDSADIPNGAVNTLEDLLADDYLREHPTEGPITMLAIPMEFDCTPISIRAPAPKLGEHTDDVLQEAGLSEDQIAAASRC